MSDSIFQDIAAKTPVRLQTTLRIVPDRPAQNGPRTGRNLDPMAREAGDRFYHCGKEIAKILYTKIDERYPNRLTDAEERRRHTARFSDAKNILNQERNQIFEAVLPLFQVTRRTVDDKVTEADTHAHDYIVKNVFFVMVRTYLAWTDELVAQADVDTTKTVIQNVADVQIEKLTRELNNFTFKFRPIVAPRH